MSTAPREKIKAAWRQRPYAGRMDIPGVGRFAMVADPQGMSFYIMRGDSPEIRRRSRPTHIGQRRLERTGHSDHKAAQAFYGELFGWENTESMPMGEWASMLHRPCRRPDRRDDDRRRGLADRAGRYYFSVPIDRRRQGPDRTGRRHGDDGSARGARRHAHHHGHRPARRRLRAGRRQSKETHRWRAR